MIIIDLANKQKIVFTCDFLCRGIRQNSTKMQKYFSLFAIHRLIKLDRLQCCSHLKFSAVNEAA